MENKRQRDKFVKIWSNFLEEFRRFRPRIRFFRPPLRRRIDVDSTNHLWLGIMACKLGDRFNSTWYGLPAEGLRRAKRSIHTNMTETHVTYSAVCYLGINLLAP